MTTATITEAAAIGRAWNVLAATDAWLEAHQSGSAQRVRDYAQWLRDDLATCRRLLLDPSDPENVHPASVYLELEDGWTDDALGQAAERITADIADGTGALVLVVGECCGQEAAEYVSSEGGGGL